jgi:cysteine synthase
LLRYTLPSAWGTDVEVELYLKDETTHITGSLKHRLARSLFLYALCNGWIGGGTTVVEASSGSTAISEAYFASLLGLPFIAVVPATTSPSKVALIESQGGRCHFVQDSGQVYAEAERVARETGGHYLDQFTNAERATDWRGNNNIAESIYAHLRDEKYPIPEWIVVGAGTGGTSATIGLLHPLPTARDAAVCGRPGEFRVLSRLRRGPRRHRHAHVFPDRGHWPASGGAIVSARRGRPHGLGARCGLDRCRPPRQRRAGTPRGPVDRHQSVGRLRAARRAGAQGRSGSVVTLLADSGDRYADTYFSDEWVSAQGRDPTGPAGALVEFERSSVWNRCPASRFGLLTGGCDRLSWLQAGCGAAW